MTTYLMLAMLRVGEEMTANEIHEAAGRFYTISHTRSALNRLVHEGKAIKRVVTDRRWGVVNHYSLNPDPQLVLDLCFAEGQAA
jgi:hypothetical protein